MQLGAKSTKSWHSKPNVFRCSTRLPRRLSKAPFSSRDRNCSAWCFRSRPLNLQNVIQLSKQTQLSRFSFGASVPQHCQPLFIQHFREMANRPPAHPQTTPPPHIQTTRCGLSGALSTLKIGENSRPLTGLVLRVFFPVHLSSVSEFVRSDSRAKYWR